MHQRLRERLAEAPPGRLRLISMCAGQGRDVLPVLQDDPRRAEVDAVLVELDSENAAEAKTAATRADLTAQVLEGDASTSDIYSPYLPADIVLACGIFGNISGGDLERTVRHLSMLTRDGGAVIWTRHWNEPALISKIQEWFAQSGFWNLSYDALDNSSRSGIGMALLTSPPLAFQRGYRFFTFLR